MQKLRNINYKIVITVLLVLFLTVRTILAWPNIDTLFVRLSSSLVILSVEFFLLAMIELFVGVKNNDVDTGYGAVVKLFIAAFLVTIAKFFIR